MLAAAERNRNLPNWITFLGGSTVTRSNRVAPESTRLGLRRGFPAFGVAKAFPRDPCQVLVLSARFRLVSAAGQAQQRLEFHLLRSLARIGERAST
jgi:hypothetical protein